jgi:hypothetical protein
LHSSADAAYNRLFVIWVTARHDNLSDNASINQFLTYPVFISQHFIHDSNVRWDTFLAGVEEDPML